VFRARQCGVAVCLLLPLLLGACTQGARAHVQRVEPPKQGSVEWSLEVDSHDRISVTHIENLLRRGGIEPDTALGGSFFAPRGWGFRGENAFRARVLLTSDPAWPEIESRQGGNSSLVKRLEKTSPVLADVTVEAAITWLTKMHPAAVPVLQDESIVRFGDGSSYYPGRSRDELLLVASMCVLDRTYLAEDGSRRTGCEVRVEMRTRDDRWARDWFGEVLSERGAWKLEMAQGGAGDRRPRK
jgi:hypothetical protein